MLEEKIGKEISLLGRFRKNIISHIVAASIAGAVIGCDTSTDDGSSNGYCCPGVYCTYPEYICHGRSDTSSNCYCSEQPHPDKG